jgi:hypothetical protein
MPVVADDVHGLNVRMFQRIVNAELGCNRLLILLFQFTRLDLNSFTA